MDATLHPILGRGKAIELGPAGFGDFELGTGRPVASGIVVEERGWTPYCIDCAARTALFVDVGPDLDLSRAVFVNLTQFDEARRALVVPLAALDALARAIPEPSRLIFLFNIGRSGTTLASAMLNEVPGVWSLSEPDVYLDLMMQRAHLDPAEVRGLIAAFTRLLFRPLAGRPCHTLAVKFRSGNITQADLYHDAFPQAACVFLYRDGVSWARSNHYFDRSIGLPSVYDRDLCRFVWWIMTAGAPMEMLEPPIDPGRETVCAEEVVAPVWAFSVEEYLRQFARGVPLLALRYNELNADPSASVARLLRFCGLPASALADALRAFERDSQAGLSIARRPRPETFTTEDRDRFLATLARHPRIRSPDLLLPDVDAPERMV